jgi:tRNA uridine 5-carboxymethylaminomethyl modification enzyme
MATLGLEGGPQSGYDLLRRPDAAIRNLLPVLPALAQQPEAVLAQAETQIKYEGYIARQALEVQRHQQQEQAEIPDGLDYAQVAGLSVEVRQKLAAHRPQTLGQASRISGVTPAAVSLLWIHLKRLRAVPQTDKEPRAA